MYPDRKKYKFVDPNVMIGGDLHGNFARNEVLDKCWFTVRPFQPHLLGTLRSKIRCSVCGRFYGSAKCLAKEASKSEEGGQ